MNYTRHFECGCKVVVIGEITNAKIVYCPKHEAAPEMYEALREMLFDDIPGSQAIGMAEQALAKAKGE